MRLVIQRSKEASVSFEDTVNSIDKGLVVLLGMTHGDTIEDINYLIRKLINLRIFDDDSGKMNYSVKDINGSILLVSQFTLYADTKDGNRPAFVKALGYEESEKLYNIFIEELSRTGIGFKTGKFGAEMKVSLINDGPVTIIIDSKDK
ncbi:MAG: D-tyrosyl-tRNA(Tyr) deacylase [Bacilli bacterium]|nr:D-tyrosyl-tRNA(Tyr) deacylase [Bacilli bacterium]